MQNNAPPDRTTIRHAFAACVRELRKRAGISQERLAWDSGIDRAYLGQLERARRTPTLETILRLLSPLGVEFEEFARTFNDCLRKQKRNRNRKNDKS